MSIDNIGDITPRVQYVASASQTAFDYPFPIFEEADIKVDVNGSTQTLSTDYTVSGETNDTGGTVTFVAGRTAGDIVTLWRDTSIQRAVDYQQNGPFLSRAINDDFDRLTVITQELESAIARSVRFPVTAVGANTAELNPIASYLSRYLFINSAGQLTPAASVTGITATQEVIGGLLYPVSAAETSAGATVVRGWFPYGDVRRYCSALETNHQQAFTDALAANRNIYVPAGTWNVDEVAINVDGTTVRTDGFATVLQQNTGTSAAQGIVRITCSDVVLGDMQYIGNIATDTGEQHHAVRVLAFDANISNIAIGNILAQDIRGDALFIGSQGATGFTCSSVTFGTVYFDNVYRNGVSIVGGTYIVGVGVFCSGRCGYATLDIEPNAGALSSDIYVGWVRGGVFQCAPTAAPQLASRIHVGALDLNPAYQANSSPGYSEGGSNYAAQIKKAIILRNTTGLTLDYLKIRDHSDFALQYIYNGGEIRGRGIRIGYFDCSGVGAAEVTLNALMDSANIETMTIDDGEVTLQSPTTDVMIIGSSATRDNRIIINRLRINGTVQRFGTNCRFSQIERNDTNNIVLFRECDNTILEASTIVSPLFVSNCTGLTVISSSVTCTGTYFGGTNSNLSLINCSGGIATDSILQGSATYDPANLVDGTGATTTVTVTGASLGDIVTGVSFSLDLQGITLSAYVSTANTVAVRFQNESGFDKDLSSGTLRVYVKKV